VFDDARAARRTDPDGVPGRLWAGMRHLIEARRACGPLHDDGATVRVFDPGSPAVFAWHRAHPRFGSLVGLANVGDSVMYVWDHPPVGDHAVDLLDPDDRDIWRLAPLQVRWISADAGYESIPRPLDGP
jgi:amylosucrase